MQRRNKSSIDDSQRAAAVGLISQLSGRLAGSVAAIESLRDQLPAIASAIDALRSTFANGGTLYTAGNGGSAAHALHLAEELIGRYRSNRPPLPAVCLNADPTALTCIANDFGFAQIFARQCQALLRAGDALLVFSTSGTSENLLHALDAAQISGALTIGVLGREGGTCCSRCTHAIVVPATDSAHIQEAHQVILHMLCEALEAPR
jgi:D-sedoheptulose 7-phosphate isomerase